MSALIPSEGQEEARQQAAQQRSSRVIVLLDCDAFYAQVESQRLGLPSTTPLAVRQWDGLVAVNYAARACGVKRFMPISEALRLCPALQLPHVEVLDSDGVASDGNSASKATHKASLHRYRIASAHIFRLLVRIVGAGGVEKGSIDEAYLDITALVERLLKAGAPFECSEAAEERKGGGTKRQREEGSSSGSDMQALEALFARLSEPAASKWHVIGSSGVDVQCGPPSAPADSEQGSSSSSSSSSSAAAAVAPFSAGALQPEDARLVAGAVITQYIRTCILAELGFTTSAGIAHNKCLAKLIAGKHKPNQQTLLPLASVRGLLAVTPLTSIRYLGSQLGARLEELARQHTERRGREAAAEGEGEEGEREGEEEEEEGRGGEGEEGEEREGKEENEDEDEEDEDEESEQESESECEGAGEEQEDTAAASAASASASASSSAAGSSAPAPRAQQASVTAGAAWALPLSHLRHALGSDSGTWCWRILRGYDEAKVLPRSLTKSFLSAKSMAVGDCRTLRAAARYLGMNCAELEQRLAEERLAHAREPRTLVVCFRHEGVMGSRSSAFPPAPHSREALLRTATALLHRAAGEVGKGKGGVEGGSTVFPCTHLAVGARDFQATSAHLSIEAMFKRQGESGGGGGGGGGGSASAAAPCSGGGAGRGAGAAASASGGGGRTLDAFLQPRPQPAVQAAPPQPPKKKATSMEIFLQGGKAAAAGAAAAAAAAAALPSGEDDEVIVVED